MERSRKVFLEISSASHKVIVAANKYADRKGLPGVQRCHFQLEAGMRRITVACDTLVGALDRSSLLDGPVFDVRLQDWLSGDEPRLCLETLSKMERLLQKDMFSWKTIFPRRRGGTTPTQDKIKEAVELLDSCKAYFHFLFTTETWNNEAGGQQQTDVHRSQERCITEGFDVLKQNLPVGVLTSTDATGLVTADHQHERAMTQRKYDMQQKKDRDASLAQNFEEILGWLDGLNCAEKQDVTLSLRQPDTCKWIFDTTQYKMWRGGECSCLWLCGKPGAGKSVLMSSVINSLEKLQKEGETITFFYCDFRNERSTSASETLRSILSQLLRRLRESIVDPRALIDDLVDAKKRGGAIRNNARELAGFASRTAKLFIKKPLVIVDALDECKDIEALLEAIDALEGSVQLFTASRPLQVIKDGLSGIPLISMDNMTEKLSADVALHVTRELDARRRLRVLGPEVKMKICTVLCDEADGMFRWVECSINTLSRCVTLREIQKALHNLPEGLDETYERILLAIDIEAREGQLALRALHWLIAALRPLHIDELMEGLSINLEERTLDFSMGPMHREALLDACGSLVTYNEKTGIVILSHFSVKEYLMSEFTRTKLFQYHIAQERAHLQLVRSCIYYISVLLKRSRESDIPSDGGASSMHIHLNSCRLLNYVLEDALDHFQYVGSQIESVLCDIEVLAEDIEQCSWLWDNTCLRSIRGTNSTVPSWPQWPVSSHNLTLYILVAFAPDTLLRAYLPRPALKPKDTNPLVYTAYFNKHEQARTLLSRGYKLNCRGWETDGSSQALPIEVALRNGHHSMVTFFVVEGSIISSQIFTLLLSRCYRDIPSSIQRMLLQTDNFVEAANDLSDVPGLQSVDYMKRFLGGDIHSQDLILIIRRMVHVACERSHFPVSQYIDSLLDVALECFREDDALETIKLLVDYGCDPVDANSFEKPPFHSAIARAHISVAQHLITLGVRVSPDILVVALKLWDSEFTAPLRVKIPMVRFLIENGADVHAHTEAGDSVLHVALQSFYEDDAFGITNLLVDRGCDLFEVNSSGKSSLHIAIEQAHLSVARHLLSLDVPVPPDIFITLNPQGIWRTTRIVRFLVGNGADVHARTETGDSVFHIALYSFQHADEALELAKLLVGYGLDLLGANFSGKLPLHIAIEQAHISVVQYFFTLGIPPPPDLLLVALNSQELVLETKMSMVKLLICSGADVHVHAETGDSVLHIVLGLFDEDDALDIAELLVSDGCDLLGANSSGRTPLHIAIEQGYTSVAQYLLFLDVSLPPDIFFVLSPHGRWKTVQMVRFLIENGADIHARNQFGDSVLHVVLESLDGLYEARKIVELLLANCCDPFEANSSGKTPLRLAIERRLSLVESYLRSLGARDGDT